MAPVLFSIAVSKEHVAHLKTKLDLTRWLDELDGAAWDYGVPLADMQRLVDLWRSDFDWRVKERKINEGFAGQQFTTDVVVDGHGTLNIHFVHKRSSRPGAVPLLFCHGCTRACVVLPCLTLLQGPARS